jgi:hypothetical protein
MVVVEILESKVFLITYPESGALPDFFLGAGLSHSHNTSTSTNDMNRSRPRAIIRGV